MAEHADHGDHHYVHGTMDIAEHRKMFSLFWTLTKWSSILIVLALVILFFTRVNAPDCTKSDVAEQYLNACGKLAREGEGPAPAPDHE